MPARPRLASKPDFAAELDAFKAGSRVVAGVDEVGRGAIAGPLVAAAVVLPNDAGILKRLDGVRDSKQLGAPQRQALDAGIRREAVALALAEVPARLIDEVGITRALVKAMNGCLAELGVAVDLALVDGRPLRGLAIRHEARVRGDQLILSIAAASIVAKVYRDQRMVDADGDFPGYGFARHKGYGTAAHLAAIHRLGPCDLHRRSWRPFQPFLEGVLDHATHGA